MFLSRLGKNAVITTVVNETLVAFRFDRRHQRRILLETPLASFLDGDTATNPLPDVLTNAANSLLILPDYWAGTTAYPFQSRKRSLARSFIQRKLLAEHPETPDIVDYFDFEFSHTGLEDRSVNVLFLQDVRAFQLYDRLAEHDLTPDRVVFPALLWEQKLFKSISEFDIGGTCFVHLLSTECFLYFFFQGRYLFSRRIVLPTPRAEAAEAAGLTMAMDAPDKFSVLTFEINQSLYLFAQKTKAEMDAIHLSAIDPQDTTKLSEALGREVVAYAPGAGASDTLGPVAAFSAADLAPSAHSVNLTHRQRRQQLEWRPVQFIGIAVGLLLVAALAVEAGYLWEKAGINRERMATGRSMSGNTQRQIIQEYSQVLNMMLEDVDRPSARRVLINVGRSMPQNAWITGIDVRTEDGPGVTLAGIIKAGSVQQLKESLSALLENLNRYFEGSRALTLESINFSLDKEHLGLAENTYIFNFEFDLP